MAARDASTSARGRRTRAAALLTAALAATAVRASDPPAGPTRIDGARLAAGPLVVAGWRFLAEDAARGASPELDDAAWPLASRPIFPRGKPLPESWRGVGWLRAPIEVGGDVAGRPLAIRLGHRGAAELFLDGEPIGAVGRVGRLPEDDEPRLQKTPLPLVFARPGPHLLAVRFSNHHVERYVAASGGAGLELSIDLPERAAAALSERTALENRYLGWFCGLFLAFALLHLLLFLFHRAIRANLDFAVLCLVLCGLVFCMTYRRVQDDPRFFLFSEPAMGVFGLALGVAALRFVYRVFYDRPPRFFFAYAAVSTAVAIWNLFDPTGALFVLFLVMLASMVELARVVVVALVRRRSGSRILGAGVATLAAGFAVGLLANLGVLPGSVVTAFLVPFNSFAALLVSMSIYLSRRFADVHRDLEARLREVERLSAEKLEQERLRRQEEVERRVLETRYEEKVRELEEARELQLALLPATLPDLPDLAVAAHMETASEVGGDYYDFQLDDAGGLVIAIGDATGHGMRAGTMVTATKSLFNVLALEHPLVDTLGRSTSALKRMNLRKLSMALTLAHYKNGELRLAAAGMPPALVYRAASGAVEQLMLAGMPLGAMARFPYRETSTRLAPGDTVLLMSDGFPERLNPHDELLGYDRAAALFAAAAAGPPAALVAHLSREAAAWAEGRPADDDATFVVLKRRPIQAAA